LKKKVKTDKAPPEIWETKEMREGLWVGLIWKMVDVMANKVKLRVYQSLLERGNPKKDPNQL